MIARILALAVAFSAGMLHAQTKPPQQAPFPGGMPQFGGSAPPPMGLAQQERFRELEQNLAQMSALVAAMKTDAAKIKDADSKRLAEENVALWERLLLHMRRAMEPLVHRMEPGSGGGARSLRPPSAPPATKPSATTPPPKQP